MYGPPLREVFFKDQSLSQSGESKIHRIEFPLLQSLIL